MKRTLVLAAILAPALVAVASCAATPDTTEVTKLLTPDYGEFAGSGASKRIRKGHGHFPPGRHDITNLLGRRIIIGHHPDPPAPRAK